MNRSGTQNFLMSGPLTDVNSLPPVGALESLLDPPIGMITKLFSKQFTDVSECMTFVIVSVCPGSWIS